MLTPTSLRLPQETLDQARAFLKATDGGSLNQLFVDLISTGLQEYGHRENQQTHKKLKPTTTQQLADLLAQSVGEQLSRNTAWAYPILQQAHLRWPVGILESRLRHNLAEKIFLAQTFSRWLTRRIVHFLDHTHPKENVFLLVDAGSTNVWLCRYLWSELSIVSKTKRENSITLLTNNVPVAEEFADSCQRNMFAGSTRIECELLGGFVEPRYAALVGKLTESSLKDKTDKRNPEQKGRYIALSAGNFLRLQSSKPSKPSFPIPLVRGAGQKPIKELYVMRSDETYILAPLSKVFLRDTGLINKELHLDKKATEPDKQQYEPVDVEGPAQQKFKLITTSRTWEKSILFHHSAAVKSRLGCSEQANGELPPHTGPIDKMEHFCFAYDQHIRGKRPAQQVRIEFPHKATRSEEFRRKFFNGQ